MNCILKFADDTKLFGSVNGKDDRIRYSLIYTVNGLVEQMANAILHLQVQCYAPRE